MQFEQLEAVTLTIDGVPVVLGQSGRTSWVPGVAGILELKATARDAAGNIGFAEVSLAVLDPNDADAPILELDASLNGTMITSLTDVIGTVIDDNLLYYSLSYAAVADGEFTEFARETSPVTNGLLGVFDPSILPNESYYIRLFAIDAGGNESSEQVFVNVAGDLKVGNFTLAFTDLSIPVSGIPITVSRTYDSLNASSEGNFGYGWRLEFADADVRSTVRKTGAEDELVYNPFYDGARVYVTVPGGERQGFTFRMTPAPGLAGSFLGLFRGSFVPDPGVTNTLTSREASLQVTTTGDAIEYTSGMPWNPFSPVFGGQLTLTTREGIVYTLNGESGDLRQVTDRNGNTLTFSDNGITSSVGASVNFERDPRGRITAVIDPAGKRIEYRYDSHGDLIGVTDREQNETTFVYGNSRRPHFLTEIIDPLGRSGIRSEYDDSGQLFRMTDSGGQVIELVHDVDSSVETVENQLGHVTTFVYDAFGNVVTERDPEGGVTRREYNDPNDPTLETAVTEVLADGTELRSEMQYDSRGNLIVQTDPLGNQARYTNNKFGDVVSTIDAMGNTTTNSYDSSGNLLAITDADGLTTTFTYDRAGNPTRLTAGTSVTTFEYDGAGRVTRQEDASGTVRTFTYDTNGNQLTETVVFTSASGPSTVVTESTYDGEGRVVGTIVKQDGVVLTQSETKHDAVGSQIESIDALGRSTKFVYDDRGQQTETIFPDETPETDSDNPRTKTIYDAAGQVVAVIDESGAITRYVYDMAGRQTKTILPAVTAADPNDVDPSDNPFTETIYDLAGRTIEQIDELGNRTRFVYDAAGNVTETILADETPGDDSDNPRLIARYDALRRRITSMDPLGNTTRFVYSDSGLLTETILPDGTPSDDTDNSRSKSGFDENRRLTARIDANGNRTEYEYDDLGRLSAVVQFVSDVSTESLKALRTEYSYDELGNLLTQTDANDHTTSFEYDGLGRRTATILPLGQRSTTEYDLAGRVTSTTDYDSQTIVFQYDVRDRLTAKLFPDGMATTFTYTVTGQRESVSNTLGTTQYEFDARDRLLSRTDPDGAKISYSYDAAGNRISVTTLVGSNAPRQTVYTFDPQNRIETVTDPEGATTTYAYDAAGRLIQTSLPNSTAEFRSYDEQSRLSLVEHRNTTTDEVFSSYAYELDRVGNRTAVTEFDGRRVEFDYDELYRLLGEDIFDPGVISVSRSVNYSYDDVGNRLTRDDSAEGVTSSTFDANDRLLTESQAPLGAGPATLTAYRYDSNGNTLAKSVNSVDQVYYWWDVENRLIAADTDASGIEDVAYEYDADGIRSARTENVDRPSEETTRFLIDANRPYQQVLEEYTPGGILKVSYVHGHDLISQNRHGGTGKSFYHVDGLGSTRALSSALGIVTDLYRYDAFGQAIGRVGSTDNAYLFAGEQRDAATGLDYLRARYMSPGVGRFVGRDSFEGRLNDPVTLHKYLYANVNPVTNIDPTGQFSLASVVAGLSVVSVLGTLGQGIIGQTAYSYSENNHPGQGTVIRKAEITDFGVSVLIGLNGFKVSVEGQGTIYIGTVGAGTDVEFRVRGKTVKQAVGGTFPLDIPLAYGELHTPRLFARTLPFGLVTGVSASAVGVVGVSANYLQIGFSRLYFAGLDSLGLDIGLEAFIGFAYRTSEK